jgi:phage FluMu protein Com
MVKGRLEKETTLTVKSKCPKCEHINSFNTSNEEGEEKIVCIECAHVYDVTW